MQIIGDVLIGLIFVFIVSKILIRCGIWGEKRTEKIAKDLMEEIKKEKVKKETKNG